MTLRIHRSPIEDVVVFALSGDVVAGHAAELQRLLEDDADRRIVLDLKDVTVVDRNAVLFLSGCQDAGVTLVNCPAYVREWIEREREADLT